MKILHPKTASLVGMVATAAISSQANAQTGTLTVTMGINMTVAQAASATASTMSFGTVTPLPGSSVVLSTSGAVTGALATAGSPAASTITVTRNAAILVSAAGPASVSMSCGTSTVTIRDFTPGGTTCSEYAATAPGCTINLGATAYFPTTAVAAGSCTQATASITLTYAGTGS